MIKMNIVGSYEGTEESKTHEGKFYCYIKPLVTAPKDLIITHKQHMEYGPDLFGTDEMGMYAIICEESQIPAVMIGEKVTCSVSCWAVAKPYWNDKKSQIEHSRRLSFFFILESEIKQSTAKAQPSSYQLNGYFDGAVRMQEGQVRIKCSFDDSPPSWLLHKVKVPKGKSSLMDAEEKLANVQIISDMVNVPVVTLNAPIEATGDVWPIREAYFKDENGCFEINVVPTPKFIVKAAIKTEKVKAA